MKLSIIIPVYNTGEYLRGCIESVMNQTLTDWELILVDDGSKDHSGRICDEYANRDRRIKVIHKDNEGVSVARNTGLASATGEYVGFVDSDDTIVPEMYEKMYRTAQKHDAEIVMCDAVTIFEDRHEEPDTITQLSCSRIIERYDWSAELLKEMAGSSWRCIYHSSLLRRCSLKFPVGLKFSEDRIFNLYAMGYADRLSYIKEPLYRRLIWDGSCVNRYHVDHFEMAKKAAVGTAQALREVWNDEESYQIAYLTQFIDAAICSINNYFYRTCPLNAFEKYHAVKALCGDEMLANALNRSLYGGVRAKWIKKQRVFMLCLCAKFLNIRYGR